MCRGIGPGACDSCRCLAYGPIQGQGIVRAGVDIVKGVCLVNEEVIFGHNGLERLFEDECLLG